MISSHLIVLNISFSIYVTKQSFIHWSSIWLRNQFLIMFIAEKILSKVAIATSKINAKVTDE